MALGILSLLCTFKYSTKCSKIAFDSDSFLELLKGLWMLLRAYQFF